MAAPVGSGNLTITGIPNLNVGSVMKCTEAPTWTGDAPPYTFQYIWKYRPAESNSADDWVRGNWTAIADPTVANLPPFPIVAGDLEYQLGIKCTDNDGASSARYTGPTGPSVAPISGGQYVATDKDNVAVSPQPGDVEITDAFGNVFDNFNEYGVVASNIKDTPQNRLVAFYDKDNVLLNPQPAYQNLGYVQYDKDNVAVTPAWQPDAAQWIPRNVENQVRTPEPYVKSPLYPGNVHRAHVPSSFIVILNVEDSEAILVTEDDVSEIRLELNIADYASTAKFR